MPGIFISYRRKDTGGHAGHLKAELGRRFGRSNVFMDVDSIPAGERYEDPIHSALAASQVALVLIGDEWLADPGGRRRRRIDHEDDWVRREVAAAIERDDVTVIPILVEGASMPSADALPPVIAPLSKIQACELSNHRWNYDFRNLCTTVERHTARGGIGGFFRGLPRWAKPVSASLALAGAAALVVLLATGGGTPSSSCANQTIPPDVRDELSVAQGTRQPAVEGSVYYGACGEQSWALAEFPGNSDGVFKQTGFTWTRLGSIEATRCRVPTELLSAWDLGGC
jgi:hypothetical protein